MFGSHHMNRRHVGLRPTWHSAPSVSPAHCVGSSFTYRIGAPCRPESAYAIGARRSSGITGQQLRSDKVTWWAHTGYGYRYLVRQLCWRPRAECFGYSAMSSQLRRPPEAVGWMFPVGKGGARRAGDTDGNIYPADIGSHKSRHACLHRNPAMNIEQTHSVPRISHA